MEEKEVVEQVEETPQSTPEKVETAKSLHDELIAYGDGSESDTAEKDSDTAEDSPAEGSEVASFFDQVLPEDERLPKPYRGKMTIGGLVENERKLVAEFNKAREEANTLRTKIQVQNHILESIGQMQAGAAQAIPQEQYQPPSENEVWKQYGIENIDAEWFDNPQKVLSAIYRRVRDEQAAVAQPIAERVQQWEEQSYVERERDVQQRAWSSAREVLGRVGEDVPPEVWVRRSPEVTQMVLADRQRWLNDPAMQAERGDPIADPLAYAAAYRTVMQRWEPVGQSPVPQQQGGNGRPQPKQPQISNPPHATRTSAATASAPKVTSRMEAEIKEWAAEWKMPVEKVREMFLEVESEKG